ncbi:serine/threonine protein phosphatase PrpC [Sphingopyxis sp. OAS728]|uniref:PP2C family protein-serine/threonine phosphatase n=1 Tax=Sphingopyxis sp. OAS728 TaxID=2663823 RepID=UPI00178A71C0|nr:protein phosphatase 2C domain-containing protein [Sphingopyxis sp. OAS728]MBE1529712.1 serine/threonine protein phosphatase PrpC [Sphingopyxis sp. OAS728]
MIFSRIFGAGRSPGQQEDATAIRSVSRTHVGKVRTINEDRILDRPERGLWAVADGMGGHSSGDVAAQMAIDRLDRLAVPRADGVLSALQSANAEIFARFDCKDRRSGTTIVAALIAGGNLDLFWAGDSRAYRIRSGAPQLLTRDHSVVQQMVDAGALSSEAAMRHPQANVITRALGVESKVSIDHAALPVLPGDIILLCSDGVSRSLGERPVAAQPIELLAQHILDEALVLDGSDNASLVLIAVQ